MTYKLGRDGWPTADTVISQRNAEICKLRAINAELVAALTAIKAETDESRDFRSAAICASIAHDALAKVKQ